MIARSPKFWFWVALCALWPIQIWFVTHDPWFRQPPKPIGDGPDYENIAFHISEGKGWALDWTNPQWQAPYRAASLSERRPTETQDPQSVAIHEWPIADYSVQFQRTDGYALTTGRPPLFPLINAAVYWLVPRGPTAFALVRLLLASCLALASSLAVALAARIMCQVTAWSWPVAVAALVAMALAALDRTSRSYATDFLTEPVALLLMQLWLWTVCQLILPAPPEAASVRAASHWWRSEGWWLIASGGLLALLIMTRSLIVLWLPGVWCMLVLAARLRGRSPRLGQRPARPPGTSWMEDARRATIIVALSMALCAPWWLRNCWVLGTFMPLGTQGPITLVGGYHDSAREMQGQWHVGPELRLREREEPAVLPGRIVEREVHVARAASREVMFWIRSHWRQVPWLAWLKLKSEWNPYSGRALAWKLAAFVGLCWLCILYRSAAALLGGVLLINTLTIMLLYSVGGRFLVPTYGILYALAGIGIACTLATRRLTAVD